MLRKESINNMTTRSPQGRGHPGLLSLWIGNGFQAAFFAWAGRGVPHQVTLGTRVSQVHRTGCIGASTVARLSK